MYLHQNDPVTKKPLPADFADVQRLQGRPQVVPKAAGTPTGPPAPTSSSTPPPGVPTAVPKPVVSMIRVNRRDLEPESEPGTRHRVARWRMTGWSYRIKSSNLEEYQNQEVELRQFHTLEDFMEEERILDPINHLCGVDVSYVASELLQ